MIVLNFFDPIYFILKTQGQTLGRWAVGENSLWKLCIPVGRTTENNTEIYGK